MGDNQLNGSLDVDQAAAAYEALADEDNEEQRELDGEDADDDAGDGEDGEPDEDDDSDSDAASEEEGQVFAVTVDGKNIRVTQKELIEGYQRTADYTRKAMVLAGERKAAETELQAVRTERQQLAQWAQQMLIKAQREAPVEPDWESLRVNDPITFAATWAQHQRYQQQQQGLVQQYDQLMRRNQEDEARALSQTIAAEDERLNLALPQWKDSARAAKEKAALLEYGRQAGFNDDELNAVYDHRTVLILRKAWLYDRIQAKRPEVARSRQSPRVAPPTNASPRRTNAAAKAMQRLERTGSIQDAAAAFERFL
jgi:hypothetical protein